MPSNSKAYQKANYKKYRGTKAELKYRSWLVKVNRDAGTYGNHDGKDWDHKNAKPTDFRKSNLRSISASTNRRLWAQKANRRRYGK